MSSPLHFTPVDTLPEIHRTLRHSFRSGQTRSLSWRKRQLYSLARMLQENHEAFFHAVKQDVGRPREETYPHEIVPVIERACASAEKLDEWAEPDTNFEKPNWQSSWSTTVHTAPMGVVLIIAPWNYPLILSLQPLAAAIAAGCTAVIKPSEISPTYATLLGQLLPKYLDPAFYHVVNAAVEGTTKLLELKWDHITYTGNGRVARIIAAAAAKHLTPITLELGGKSPVIVDHESDLRLVARRILYGKISNSGQICVCPDYIIIRRDKQDALVEALKATLLEFFPDGALKSSDYAHIVNEMHYNRILGLLSRTKGEVVVRGRVDEARLAIETTIIKNVSGEDSLMEEEIFGPLLPIIPVDSIDDAVEFINARPHPLVLYCFTQNPDIKAYVLENTTSGGICFNDTFQQMATTVPFGGVGESGYGRQILQEGFKTYSYQRSCVEIPFEEETNFSIRYPPFNEDKFRVLSASLHTPIPKL